MVLARGTVCEGVLQCHRAPYRLKQSPGCSLLSGGRTEVHYELEECTEEGGRVRVGLGGTYRAFTIW